MAGLTVSVSMSRLTWLKLKRSSVTKLRTEHMAPGGRDGRSPAPYLRREVVGRGKKKKGKQARQDWGPMATDGESRSVG